MSHVFLQVTNDSSSTLYHLNVRVPDIPPLYHSIPFTVNIINPTTISTSTIAAMAGDDVNSTIIIVVVILVSVLVTALVVLFILYWRLRQKHSSTFSSSSSKQQGNSKWFHNHLKRIR